MKLRRDNIRERTFREVYAICVRSQHEGLLLCTENTALREALEYSGGASGTKGLTGSRALINSRHTKQFAYEAVQRQMSPVIAQ